MSVPLLLSQVPAANPYIQYVASSGQTVFPYPFAITQDSDLIAVANGVTLATDSGYSLSGQGNATGGNLTFTAGRTAGDIITLYRDVTIQRISQISQNSGFASTVFNAEFNQIYLIMQQLEAQFAQCLQIPNTNNPPPTTTLLPASYANKYLAFDGNGNPTPAVLTSSGSLTASIIAGLLNLFTTAAPTADKVRSAAEISAGVTPTNYAWPVGDIRRYGAVLDGVTDDTVAVTNWAKVGGRLVFPVAQTALISTAVPLVSNSTLEFAEGATIKSTTAISIFTMTTLSNTVVRGASFLQTGASGAASSSGVAMTSCTYCTVEDCTFNGMGFYGIYATACSYCTVRNNYFGASASGIGQIQDSGDIQFVSSASVTSSYNVIDGNFCYGGGEFGIAVWDPYSGVLPIHNVISNNRIGGCSGYGILLYMPDIGDTYNQAIGNDIEGILGNIASNNSTGAGIYLVGQGLGGTVIANNTIRNCCIDTANATLAPAGIGVNGGSMSTVNVPISITGNVISDMPAYHGILLTGVETGAVVSGNTIRMPASQTTIGNAITVTNSFGVSVVGNSIMLLAGTANIGGIVLSAQGQNMSGLSVTGNTIIGGHFAQIRIVGTSGQVEVVSVSGNSCIGGDSSCIPFKLESGSCFFVSVTGNTFYSNSANAISQTACTSVSYSANFVTGSGAILSTSGTCTSSFYDRSNIGQGVGAGVSNAATGFVIEALGSAAPAAGTWAVGDTVRNAAPSAAGVYEWICTTAGTGGGTAVFKTISNT